ncbi:thiolase family protein [Sphingobium sp.]|uniref:thiolase family protein n=1 Tax=Sphingobium sp. TaxID=1912891 RepID=UPI0028BF2009|nr:thiolase family protein [Sphingobium sp.]
MRLGSDIAGRTAIVGIGASSFERRPDASVFQFAGEALHGALNDAGLVKEQIDGLIVQVGSPRGADYDGIAETFGLSPRFCSQTWAHGRFAATVIAHAAMAVATGMATRVACLMAMKNSDLGRIGEANNPFFHEQFRENGGPHGEAGHIGMASPVAGAAMGFDLYCRRYGHDREMLGAIPIAFRGHARLTDDAVMRGPMAWEDYRAARPIIDPLRLLDCSPVGDGAVCAIVAAADAPRSVAITGMQGIRAGRETFIFAPYGLGMNQQSGKRLSLAEACAQQVYAMAATAPEAIDVLGLYDSFSPLPLYALEDFGFCGEGEALPWVQDGRIALGGALPTNTSGGQLSQAQMNGWGQIRELVTQLRGEAGGRQVDGARRAMWATVGGDALILERS